VAVRTSDLALGNFALNFFPTYTVNYKLGDPSFLVVDVIELKNNRIGLTTIDTGMSG
jgi:hypothetical protein